MSVEIFVSYSHVDKALRDQLEVVLTPLMNSGRISVWHDRRIAPGEDWAGQISEHLESADIVLVLVSPDFLASEYCWDVELTRAIERSTQGHVRLIPIILWPCLWEETLPLKGLQALPRSGKPIANQRRRKEAFYEVAQGLLEVLDEMERRAKAPLRGRVDANLPNTGDGLFGRENELKELNRAWEKAADRRILVMVASGGVGKTSLVKNWLESLEAVGYRGAERVFAWSFYWQGTDREGISADLFLERAFAFFGLKAADDEVSSHERGVRLAEKVSKGRNLLVLDGVEPLQYPSGPLKGQLRDPALKALFRRLAAANPGLCVVTTRIPIPELMELGCTFFELDHLSPEAGRRLLRHLGVQGSNQQMCKASAEFEGHALALTLLGTYLVQFSDGKISKRSQIPRPASDDTRREHAQRMMRSFEEKLGNRPEQLALLRMLGLFDRPATHGEIQALLEERPGIRGLTQLTAIFRSPPTWQKLISTVRETRLVEQRSPRDPSALDVHPMVREYFGDRFHSTSPTGWKKGHGRLYEYHRKAVLARRSAPDDCEPEDFRQLLAAVVHGCKAGRYTEALEEVYRTWIIQKHHSFHTRIFRVPSALLTGIIEFFKPASRRPVAKLSDSQKAFVQEELGHCLLLLGRLEDARKPLQDSIDARKALGNYHLASKHSRLLREAHLILGDLGPALKTAHRSVALAEETRRPDALMRQKSGLGQVLHWMGDWEAAQNSFLEAERELANWDGGKKELYSYYGFWYSELLLDLGEAAANGRMPDVGTYFLKKKRPRDTFDRVLAILGEARKRASQSLNFARKSKWHIDQALDSLTIGRSLLLEAACKGSDVPAAAIRHIDFAMKGLQQAGQKHYLIRGFLGRAALSRYRGDLNGAEADAEEAFEIARTCRMTPFKADANLELCLLELIRGGSNLEEAKGYLASAREIMEATSYFRRRPAIELLEAMISSGHVPTGIPPLALRHLGILG